MYKNQPIRTQKNYKNVNYSSNFFCSKTRVAVYEQFQWQWHSLIQQIVVFYIYFTKLKPMSLGRSGACGILTGGNLSHFFNSQSRERGPGLPSPMTSLTSAQQLEQPQMSIWWPMFCSFGLFRALQFPWQMPNPSSMESCFQWWQKGRAELKQLFYIYSEKLSFRNC